MEDLILPVLDEEPTHRNAKWFASGSQRNGRTRIKLQPFRTKTIARTATAIFLLHKLYYVYLTRPLKISVSFLNEHKTELNYFLFSGNS